MTKNQLICQMAAQIASVYLLGEIRMGENFPDEGRKEDTIDEAVLMAKDIFQKVYFDDQETEESTEFSNAIGSEDVEVKDQLDPHMKRLSEHAES